MAGADVRELVRSFLGVDEVLERLRGDEDELEALLDLVAEPPLAPHVVHVDPTFEDEDTSWYDDPPKLDKAGAPILHKRTTRVRRQVVVTCPDCRLGLVSRGGDLICSRLPRSTELVGDHEGCIVACGLEG